MTGPQDGTLSCGAGPSGVFGVALRGHGVGTSSCSMKSLRLVLALTTLLAPAHAIAEEAALSERDRNVARESVYQGDDLVKRGDHRGALEAYRRANAIMKVPTTGIEVARTSLRLGLLVEALEAARQTAAFPQKSGEPAPFTKARDEARAVMVSLRTRIPKITIAVLAPSDVTPQVVLDGAAIGELVLVPVNPGTHHVTASAPNLVSAEADVTLDEGETQRVELILKAPTGVKIVTTATPSTYWPLVYTGLALTVAGVAGGTATGVMSLDAAKELGTRCDPTGQCPAGEGLEDLIDRRNTLGYISTGAFALAGVGAALAIPSLVVSLRRRTEAPKVSLAPLFDVAGRPTLGGALTIW